MCRLFYDVKIATKGRDVAPFAGCLPSMHEVLGSITGTTVSIKYQSNKVSPGYERPLHSCPHGYFICLYEMCTRSRQCSTGR